MAVRYRYGVSTHRETRAVIARIGGIVVPYTKYKETYRP